MKKINLAALLFAGVLSTSAFAEMTPGFYVGVNAGNLSVDSSVLDDMSVTGIKLGYQFANNIALEFQTLSGDEHFFDGGNGSYDISTSAIYGVWRVKSYDTFLQAKAGVLSRKIDYSYFYSDAFNTISESSSTTESALSYGVGGGLYITDHFIAEAEYIVLDSDFSAITLGLTYKF